MHRCLTGLLAVNRPPLPVRSTRATSIARRPGPGFRSPKLLPRRVGLTGPRLEQARCLVAGAHLRFEREERVSTDVSESLTASAAESSRRGASGAARAGHADADRRVRPSQLGSARLRWSQGAARLARSRRVAIGSSSSASSAKRTAVSDASSSHWTSSTARPEGPVRGEESQAARNAGRHRHVRRPESRTRRSRQRIERARRWIGGGSRKDGVGDGAEKVRQPGVGEGRLGLRARQDNVL